MTLLLLLALSSSPDAGVSPTFSRRAVNKVVRRHASELRACGTGGTITLTFVVGPEGRVHDVATESMTITDAPDILSCVIQALRSWNFPSPGKTSVTVKSYSFVLPAR